MARLCFSVSPAKEDVQQHDCLLLLWLIGTSTVSSDPLAAPGNCQNPAAASIGTGNTSVCVGGGWTAPHCLVTFQHQNSYSAPPHTDSGNHGKGFICSHKKPQQY